MTKATFTGKGIYYPLPERIKDSMRENPAYDKYYDLIRLEDGTHYPVPCLEGNFNPLGLLKTARSVHIRTDEYFWNDGNPSFYSEYEHPCSCSCEWEWECTCVPSRSEESERRQKVISAIVKGEYAYVSAYWNLW